MEVLVERLTCHGERAAELEQAMSITANGFQVWSGYFAFMH